MGRGSQSSSQGYSSESQTVFAPRGSQEQALLDQFQNLGQSQQQGLQGLLDQLQNPNYSAYTLNPADQANLNASYDAARQQLNLDNRDFAASLAGSRGLRMSDTPVAQQALQRQGLGNAALESDRARAMLDYGFQGNQARTNNLLMGAQALPSGMVAAFNPLFSERMASGKTFQSGTGTMTGSTTQPIMQSILQGTQAYNQLGQGTQAFMGAGKTGMSSGLFG